MSLPARKTTRVRCLLAFATCLALVGAPSSSSGTPEEESAVSVARAHAKQALKLAIDQLQATAGPDQRVTARADILGSNVTRPRLTGVWNSWEIKANEPPSAADYDSLAKGTKFLRWLVSNPDAGALTQIDFVNSSVASPVTLMGQGSLGSQAPASSIVTASKVQVVSPPGSYAWAVFDEGVKARINTPFSKTAISTANRTQQLGSGERPGTEFIPGLSGLSRAYFEDTSLEFANLTQGIGNTNFTPTAEAIAPGSAAALRSLAHDVTLHSLGLFTDTARGGLKQDFHLLTNLTNLPNKYSGRGVYNSVLAMPSADAPSDPRWESFQQFAAVYRDASSLTSSGGVPVLQVKAPSSWNAATKIGSSLPLLNPRPPPGVVLLPTIAKVQLLFTLMGRDIYAGLPENIQRPLTTAEKVSMLSPKDAYFKDTNYNYGLHLLYTPIITLHNPYNVALEFNTMRVELMGIPFSMQVFRNGIALSRGLVPFESMTQDNQDSQRRKFFGMNLKTKVNGRVGGNVFRMLPGEVILFSPYFDPTTTFAREMTFKTFWDFSLASSLTNSINMIPGWRGPGVGYDTDWLAGNQPVVTGNAAKQPPYGIWEGCYGLAWDDRIHVEFAPIGIPVNANKLVIQMAATVGGITNKKISAIEIDYESPTGLQGFLNGDGSTRTLRFPAADDNPNFVLGYQLRNSSRTQIRDLSNPKPFALLTAQARNTSSGIDSSNRSGRFAGKPWAFTHGSIGASSQKLVTEHPANHSHELDLLALNSSDFSTLLSVDAQDRSRFISGSTGADKSTKFGTLYDIPIAPIQSLASLNGANPGGSSGYLPRFAQPIGNSWAHPLISPWRITERGPSGYNYLDHSFLLNLAFYDGFYFSGFAQPSGAFGSGGSVSGLVNAFATGTPLNDPRLILYRPNDQPASSLSAEIAKPSSYSSIAAWQLMAGAFNVNSTSVPAWKAMLASTHDANAILNGRATSSATTTSLTPLDPTSAGKSRISRMRLPGSKSLADGGQYQDAYWLGPREYSDAELQTLAERIVEQVRLRGPFLSMAEFVNRRLGSESDEKAQRGALQQAIDNANLNQSLAGNSLAGYEIPRAAVTTYKYNNPSAGSGSSYQGAPGYLTQADILSVLGNAATVRSDTFVIRSYGEALGATGGTAATAFCEAVVQRLPDWVEPIDKAETQPAALTSARNKTLGRGFRVISFRWLTPDEI